jgi:hypothetical protein
VATAHAWTPGQRALLRFLEREGLVQGLPEPPPGDGAPADDGLFAIIASMVPPSVLAELLSARLHLPILESDDAVGAEANELLAAAVATRCGIVPVAATAQTLEVATANPLDLDAVKTVEFAAGKRVRVRVATPETVRRALVRLYGDEAGPAAAPIEAAATPVEAPLPVEDAVAPVGAAPEPPPEPEASPLGADTPSCDAQIGEGESEITLPLGEADAPAPCAVASGSDGAPEPEPSPSAAPQVARTPRVLVMVGDAVAREQLGGAVRDGAPGWLVMTAQDAGEGDLVAMVAQPDVVIVDSATGDLGTGCLAACPLVVADEYETVDDVLTLARTLIDTARSG